MGCQPASSAGSRSEPVCNQANEHCQGGTAWVAVPTRRRGVQAPVSGVVFGLGADQYRASWVVASADACWPCTPSLLRCQRPQRRAAGVRRPSFSVLRVNDQDRPQRCQLHHPAAGLSAASASAAAASAVPDRTACKPGSHRKAVRPTSVSCFPAFPGRCSSYWLNSEACGTARKLPGSRPEAARGGTFIFGTYDLCDGGLGHVLLRLVAEGGRPWGAICLAPAGLQLWPATGSAALSLALS